MTTNTASNAANESRRFTARDLIETMEKLEFHRPTGPRCIFVGPQYYEIIKARSCLEIPEGIEELGWPLYGFIRCDPRLKGVQSVQLWTQAEIDAWQKDIANNKSLNG